MDKDEARAVLAGHMKAFEAMSVGELKALMGEPQVAQVNGPSGAEYQIEVEVFWDADEGGDIRVMGGIDDGGWSAWKPLCQDFVKR